MSGIDLSQFHAIFFEESFEWLDTLEAQLLDCDQADSEQINLMFRAAHSIKGGAATFGFSAVANIMHEAETLMDRWRSGRSVPSNSLITVLLNAVDVCRTIIGALQAGDTEFPDHGDILHALRAHTDEETPESNVPDEPTNTQAGRWRITLVPKPELLLSGNDPIKLFNVLEDLGQVTGTIDTQGLAGADFDPTLCYLTFTVVLDSQASLEEIADIFEWIDDDADVDITPLDSVVSESELEPTSAPIAASSPDKPAAVSEPKSAAPATSIRVSTDKLDQLINLVGELVITQSMLGELGREVTGQAAERMQAGLEQLEQNTRELQESVMRVRMLPMSFAFSRYPRMVHDLSGQLGKSVNLLIEGENTEIDKTLLEKITDPLTHMVRNAIDHGIESPEKRQQANKPSAGTVTLKAYHQGGNVIIEVVDDGGGVDPAKVEAKAIERGLISAEHGLEPQQLQELIFEPGFSTATQVSDVSGRGVGMDVVKRNIQQLGGQIHFSSKVGQGSTIAVTLPLTLSILDGQLVQVAEGVYVIPLLSIVESMQLAPEQLRVIDTGERVFRLRDQHIPLRRLDEVLSLREEIPPINDGIVVVVDSTAGRFGLLVDELLSQQQVVIKSLEDNYQRVPGLSGATILGNGQVAMILDPTSIASLVEMRGQA